MTAPPLRIRLAIGLAIAVAAWLASSPGLDGSFVYDDHHYVVDNPAVSGDASPWTSPLGDPRQALWRPLTVASWRLQWSEPASAGPFLAVNLLLHVGVSLLVLALGLRLALGWAAAGVAALLFATHPVHAEAVAWVTGRSELLAAAGVLGAWCLHLGRRDGLGLGAAVLVALAGLAKESALVAPALFALVDIVGARRPWPVQRWILLALAAATVTAARGLILPEFLPEGAPFGHLAVADRGVVAANILARALQLCLWPTALRVHYHRDELVVSSVTTVVVLAAFALAVLWLGKRSRTAAGLGAAFPLALATVLNLVPIGATFAERFLYLPSALLCLAAGALLARWSESERTSSVSALLLALLLLAALPAARSAARAWHDEVSLWSAAVRASPADPIAHYNLGQALDAAGRFLTEERDRPGSVDELWTSLRLHPRHDYAGLAHAILGTYALGAAGDSLPDPEGAAHHFRTAIERLPHLPEPRLNLASLALAAPGIVPAGEALAALVPLVGREDLSDEQRRALAAFVEQLAAQPSSSAGTSSADGS